MILVYTENTNGKFKKSTYEALSYAKAIGQKLNVDVAAISFGTTNNDELKNLAQYGANKIFQVINSKFQSFNGQAYASAIAEAALQNNCNVVVIGNSFSGKGLAPRVAIKLNAGFVDGAISLPDTSNGFVVRKGAYSGKAFADVNVLAATKVISLVPNSYKVETNPCETNIEEFNPTVKESDFKLTIKETVRAGDKISLPEAELVVSAGRGLKGPENWGMVEELAGLLGAATACSKPVSDSHWRPHSEHVGQTGIAISPNLYIAIGISGAIQHLAGVSSSKTIVVINKDAEAPFFKAADYGIVGDAFEIVPKLIESVKKFKAAI